MPRPSLRMLPTHWPSPFVICTPPARCSGNTPAPADKILSTMRLLFALSVWLTAACSLAQQPATPPAPTADASVTFSFDWNQGIPWQRYLIQVQSDGKTHFDGTPTPSEPRDTDEYQLDFIMSDANRQKIFELSRKLNFFHGDFDSHLKHIAQTGSKTLEYKSPQVQGTTTYNWSQNADVEELTKLFQAIATTIDFGRKLAFQYRFDKLGMDERLKELQDLQASHQ